MRRMLLFACGLLAACAPALEESDDEPTPEKGNFASVISDMPPLTPEQVSLQAFLSEMYGSHADVRGLWWEQEAEVQHQVCATATPAKGLRIVAVCHVGGSHGDFGEVEIFSLAEKNGKLRALASERRPVRGSFGGEHVRAVRFGKDAVAIAIKDRDGAGSEQASQKSVAFYAFVDGRLVTIAEGRSELWDDCEHELLCGDGDWTVFKYSFDESTPAAAAYPMLIHEDGSECLDEFDRKYRVEFDAELHKYRLPPALTRNVTDCESALLKSAHRDLKRPVVSADPKEDAR